MSNKELSFFVCFIILTVLLFCTVFVLEATGHASMLVKDFSVDADGTICLLTENQVRILSSDQTVTVFRPAIRAQEHIETDGNTITLFYGDRFVCFDYKGHELSRGPVEEHPDWYMIAKKPVSHGDAAYSYHSLFGFYRIVKQSGGEAAVCYRIPTGDALLRVMMVVACLLLFTGGLGFPLYFLKNKRFAKDGRILPKQDPANKSAQ